MKGKHYVLAQLGEAVPLGDFLSLPVNSRAVVLGHAGANGCQLAQFPARLRGLHQSQARSTAAPGLPTHCTLLAPVSGHPNRAGYPIGSCLQFCLVVANPPSRPSVGWPAALVFSSAPLTIYCGIYYGRIRAEGFDTATCPPEIPAHAMTVGIINPQNPPSVNSAQSGIRLNNGEHNMAPSR